MAKQTIELTIPEGYEVAEGAQPRQAYNDDLIYYLNTGQVKKYYRSDSIPSECNHIILKRIVPKYKVTYLGRLPTDGKYVEIKALEDALSLVGITSGDDADLYCALKELIK